MTYTTAFKMDDLLKYAILANTMNDMIQSNMAMLPKRNDRKYFNMGGICSQNKKMETRSTCWQDQISAPRSPYWNAASAFHHCDIDTIMKMDKSILYTYECGSLPIMYLFIHKKQHEQHDVYIVLLRMLQNNMITDVNDMVLYRDYMKRDIKLLHEACIMNMPSLIPLLLMYGARLECDIQNILTINDSYTIIWRELFEYGLNPHTYDIGVVLGRNTIIRFNNFLKDHDIPYDSYIPRMALYAWARGASDLTLIIIHAAHRVPSLTLLCQRCVWKNDVNTQSLPYMLMIPKRINIK